MIDVIIVNWNSGAGLEACLDSLTSLAPNIRGQIIVVDNQSSDGSESCCGKWTQVNLIHAGGNLGFARACNLGAQRSTSEWMLFLNPDTRFLPPTQDALFGMLSKLDDRTGICGAQLLDEEGRVARSCARFPSPWMFLCHTVGVDRFIPSLGYPMQDWDHFTSRNVDHVIGAFYLVRRKLFQELNGFDERFFLYLEDLDFSLRARQSGWNTLFCADLKIFHEGGGTSKQIKATRLFYDLRSRLLYAQKYFPSWQARFQVMAMICLEPFSRFIGIFLRPSKNAFKVLFQGYTKFLHWWVHA
jgi:GT2 family glycosyltransferase